VSYDLVFWRFKPGRKGPPAMACEALLDGGDPDDLEALPIEEVLGAILAAYPKARRGPNGAEEWIEWSDDANRQVFEVWWSPKHFRVVCRGLPGEMMNAFIDIAHSFGCPLYDPQTGERFDAHSPN
jgi:hypothetical protein